MENYTVEQLMELIEYKPDVMLPRMFVLNWHLIETTNEPYEDYLLLLQVDSDEGIRWKGDGVANFFIHPDDLIRKDFSNVLFTFGSY